MRGVPNQTPAQLRVIAVTRGQRIKDLERAMKRGIADLNHLQEFVAADRMQRVLEEG